jgi:hypothetical protein
MLSVWWTWARWVLMVNFMFIGQGVFFFLSAMYLNFKLRRPWPKFERVWSDGDVLALDIDGLPDGPLGYYRLRPQNFLAREGFYFTFMFALIVFFLFLSTALIMKNRKYVEMRNNEDANITSINTAIEAAIGPELFKKFGHFLLASRIRPEDLSLLTNPYEINRILNVPLGPAILIAKKLADAKKE